MQRHAVCSGDLLALHPPAFLPFAFEVETDRPSLIVYDRLFELRFREVKVLLVGFEERGLELLIGLAPRIELPPGNSGRFARRRDVARLSLERDQEQLLPAVRLRRLRVATRFIAAAHAPTAIAFCRLLCAASCRARFVPTGHTSQARIVSSLPPAGKMRRLMHACSRSRSRHFLAA